MMMMMVMVAITVKAVIDANTVATAQWAESGHGNGGRRIAAAHSHAAHRRRTSRLNTSVWAAAVQLAMLAMIKDHITETQTTIARHCRAAHRRRTTVMAHNINQIATTIIIIIIIMITVIVVVVVVLHYY